MTLPMTSYVGRSGFGRAFHVLKLEKPAGAGPHDPFWNTRPVWTVCGRRISVTPVGDTFADGTPIPVCRACLRAEARL